MCVLVGFVTCVLKGRGRGGGRGQIPSSATPSLPAHLDMYNTCYHVPSLMLMILVFLKSCIVPLFQYANGTSNVL